MIENASTLAVLLFLCDRLIASAGSLEPASTVSQMNKKSPDHGVPILDGARTLLSETPEEPPDSDSRQPYQPSKPYQFQDLRSNQNGEVQKISRSVEGTPMSRSVTVAAIEIINNNPISFRDGSPNLMTLSQSSGQDNIAPNSRFPSSKELANKIPIHVVTHPLARDALLSLINMETFPKETINPDILKILLSVRFPPGNVPLMLLAVPIFAAWPRADLNPQLRSLSGRWQEYSRLSPMDTDKHYPHAGYEHPQDQYPRFPLDNQIEGHPGIITDYIKQRPEVISEVERFEIPAQPLVGLRPEYPKLTQADTDEQYSFPRLFPIGKQPLGQYPQLLSNRHVKSNHTVPSDHIASRLDMISREGKFEIPRQHQNDTLSEYPHLSQTDKDKPYPYVEIQLPKYKKYSQFPSNREDKLYPRVPNDYNAPRPKVISDGLRTTIPGQLRLAPTPVYPYHSPLESDRPNPYVVVEPPRHQYTQIPSGPWIKNFPRVPDDYAKPRTNVISNGKRFDLPAQPQYKRQQTFPKPNPSYTDDQYSFPWVDNTEKQDTDQSQFKPQPEYPPQYSIHSDDRFPDVTVQPTQNEYPLFPSKNHDKNYPRAPTEYTKPRPNFISSGERIGITTQLQPKLQQEYPKPTPRGINEQPSSPRQVVHEPQEYPPVPFGPQVERYPRIPTAYTKQRPDITAGIEGFEKTAQLPYPDTDRQYRSADEHSHHPSSDSQALVISEFPFDNTKTDITSTVNRLVIPEQLHSEPLPKYPHHSPESTEERYRYSQVGVQEPRNQYPRFQIDRQVINQSEVPSAKAEISAVAPQTHSEPLAEYLVQYSPLSRDEWYRSPHVRGKQRQEQYPRIPSDHQVSGYPRVPSDDFKPRPDISSNAHIIYIPSHLQPAQPSRPYSDEHYYYPHSPIQLQYNVEHPQKNDYTKGYPASKLPTDDTQSGSDSINLPEQLHMYPHITPENTNEPHYTIHKSGGFEKFSSKENPRMRSDGQVSGLPVPYPTERIPVEANSNVPVLQVKPSPKFLLEYPIHTTPPKIKEVYNNTDNLLQRDRYPYLGQQPRPNVDLNVQRVDITHQPLSQPQENFPVYVDDNGNVPNRQSSQGLNPDHNSHSPSEGQGPRFFYPIPHVPSMDGIPGIVSKDHVPLLKHPSPGTPEVTTLDPAADLSKLPQTTMPSVPSDDLRTENKIPKYIEQLPSNIGEWSSFEPDVSSQPGRLKIPEKDIRPHGNSTRPLFTPIDTYDQPGWPNKPKSHRQQASFPENPVQTHLSDRILPQETFTRGKPSLTESDGERIKEFYAPNSLRGFSQPQYPPMDEHASALNTQFPLDDGKTEYLDDDSTQKLPAIRLDMGSFEFTETPIYYKENPQHDSTGTKVPERFIGRFSTHIYPGVLKPDRSKPQLLSVQYHSENPRINPDVRLLLPKSSSQPDNGQTQRFSIPGELTPPVADYSEYPPTYNNDNTEIEVPSRPQSIYSTMGSHKPIQLISKSMPVQTTNIPEQAASHTNGNPLHDSHYPYTISEKLDKHRNYSPYSRRVPQNHPDEEEPPTSRPDQRLTLNFLHPYPIDDRVPEIDLLEVPERQRATGATHKHKEGPSTHKIPPAGVDDDTFTVPKPISQPQSSEYLQHSLTDTKVPSDIYPGYPPKHAPKMQYPKEYPDQDLEDFPVTDPKSIIGNVHMDMGRMEVIEPSTEIFPPDVIHPLPPDEQSTIIPNGNYFTDKIIRRLPGYSDMFPYGESTRPEVSKHNKLEDFPTKNLATSVEGGVEPTIFMYPDQRRSGILPIQPYGSQLESSPIGSIVMSDYSRNREPDKRHSTPGRMGYFLKDHLRDQHLSYESALNLPRSERYPSLGISKDSFVGTSEPFQEEPFTTTRYKDSVHTYPTNLYSIPSHLPQPSVKYDPVTTSEAPQEKQPDQPTPQDPMDTTILTPTSASVGILARPIQRPAPQFPLISLNSPHPETSNDQTANPLEDGEQRLSKSIPRGESTITSIDFPTSNNTTNDNLTTSQSQHRKRPDNGSITHLSVDERNESLLTTEKTIDMGTTLYESADDELTTQPHQVLPAQALTYNIPLLKLDGEDVSQERTPSEGVTVTDPQLTSFESGRSPTATLCSVTAASDGRNRPALTTSQDLPPCINDSPLRMPINQPDIHDGKITRILPDSKPTFYTEKDGHSYVNLKEPIFSTTTSQRIVFSEAPGSPQPPKMVDLVVPIAEDVIPNQEKNNLPSLSLPLNSTLPHLILESIPSDNVQVFDAQTIIKAIESCDCENIKFLIPILKRPKSAIFMANNEDPGTALYP